MQLTAGAVNVSNFSGLGGGLCLLPHQSRCLVSRLPLSEQGLTESGRVLQSSC